MISRAFPVSELRRNAIVQGYFYPVHAINNKKKIDHNTKSRIDLLVDLVEIYYSLIVYIVVRDRIHSKNNYYNIPTFKKINEKRMINFYHSPI